MTETASTTSAVQSDSPARLVVCERSGTWAAALRRAMPPGGPQVHEVRSLAECAAALPEWPASFVVLEMAAAPLRTLGRLVSWSRDFPRAAIAVVTAESLAWLEADVREAGAVALATSPRRVAGIVSIALRHLARAPRPQQELTERIWSELPWG